MISELKKDTDTKLQRYKKVNDATKRNFGTQLLIDTELGLQNTTLRIKRSYCSEI
jgi:hypothetical protein